MSSLHWIRRGLAAAAGGLALVLSAHAEAPQVKTQAPGFYRMMLGDIEVTALLDGVLDFAPKSYLTNATPVQLEQLMARSFESDTVPMSVNGYLINTGSKLVLVDTGMGKLMGKALGHLIENLKASGYQPEQVDVVLITHMHRDHVGGLSPEGQRAFANATVRVEQHEADHWLSQAKMEAAPKDAQAAFKTAQAAFAPYQGAGRFKPFEGDTEIVPGVKAVPAPGHTAGHSTYVIESKGQKLVLWGDLMHVAAVQFAQPNVTIKSDFNADAAAAQRKKAYAEAAQGRHLVAGAHLPFPGLGHVRAEGEGYAWVPVHYNAVR